jgi:hypothetical protein
MIPVQPTTHQMVKNIQSCCIDSHRSQSQQQFSIMVRKQCQQHFFIVVRTNVQQKALVKATQDKILTMKIDFTEKGKLKLDVVDYVDNMI